MSEYTKQIAEKRQQIQQVLSEIQRLEQVGLRLQGHLECLEELQSQQENPVEEHAKNLDTEILAKAKEAD